MITYFPIFRGKQFELIAIREFAEQAQHRELVHPVIEPVRNPADNSGLARVVQTLAHHDMPHTVIVNPSKGSMANDPAAPALILQKLEEAGAASGLLIPGVLLHGGTPADHIADCISGSAFATGPINLVYDRPPAVAEDVGQLRRFEVGHHIAGDRRAVRRLPWPTTPPPNFVQLDQPFVRRASNLEYVGSAPSLFNDAHVHAEGDGFKGIADYLTVGDEYSETGGLPLALVIHLTYDEPSEDAIFIRAFHSTTNKDQSDPAGKFLEAVAALVAFIDERRMHNPALDAFRAYHQERRYPGLGVLKKLSMLNHMYVMSEALSKQ